MLRVAANIDEDMIGKTEELERAIGKGEEQVKSCAGAQDRQADG